MSWIALLNNDTGAYNAAIAQIRSAGSTYHDKDKQAMNEVAAGAPSAELLKARLLFDGGYYSGALAELSDVQAATFKKEKDKVEFYYRMGRIYDALGKDETALQYYQRTVNAGKDLKYYYAATAALNMGKIYSGRNNAKARICFSMACNMKNHEYENSIEAQAKEGLRALGD